MKKNNDGILPGETDCRPLEGPLLHKGIPKDDLLRIAANELAKCFEIEVLAAIVTGGLDKFEAIARPAWAAHEFEPKHFRKAFQIVTKALDARTKLLRTKKAVIQ